MSRISHSGSLPAAAIGAAGVDDDAPDAERVPQDATFEQVCDLALPRLYAFIRAQVASRDLARELLGRVLLKASQRWVGQRCSEATMNWLFRTARTTLIDYWRVDGRGARVNVPLDELKVSAASARTPEQAYEAKQWQATLLVALSDLDADSRSLLALKFAGQRTNREIARILGVSDAVVSMRLLRALRRLRTRLDHMGVS